MLLNIPYRYCIPCWCWDLCYSCYPGWRICALILWSQQGSLGVSRCFITSCIFSLFIFRPFVLIWSQLALHGRKSTFIFQRALVGYHRAPGTPWVGFTLPGYPLLLHYTLLANGTIVTRQLIRIGGWDICSLTWIVRRSPSLALVQRVSIRVRFWSIRSSWNFQRRNWHWNSLFGFPIVDCKCI